MNYFNFKNQKIAYFDNQVNNQALVFVHGNSLSSQTFLHQLKDKPLNKYRLIAIDLPGHGDSSKAEEPEKMYSIAGFISILLEFVNKLDLHDAIFVGHSMGGHVILNASARLSSAKGFVIFGTPPFNFPPDMGKYFLPNPVISLAYKPDLTSNEINELASAYVKKDTETPDVIIKDIKRSHQEMRASLLASFIPENMANEVEIIENIAQPVAIFHGMNDQLVNGEYLKELNIPTLWQNKIITIPDSGHCPQIENPKDFSQKLIEFIDHIS